MPTSAPVRVLSLVVVLGVAAAAQTRPAGGGRARNPGLTGWCETPVAERTAEPGCYTTAITELGTLPASPLFWHLDTYADRAAAEASRGPRGTVVDGHGKHWLFTIAEESWRPARGERVA